MDNVSIWHNHQIAFNQECKRELIPSEDKVGLSEARSKMVVEQAETEQGLRSCRSIVPHSASQWGKKQHQSRGNFFVHNNFYWNDREGRNALIPRYFWSWMWLKWMNDWQNFLESNIQQNIRDNPFSLPVFSTDQSDFRTQPSVLVPSALYRVAYHSILSAIAVSQIPFGRTPTMSCTLVTAVLSSGPKLSSTGTFWS